MNITVQIPDAVLTQAVQSAISAQVTAQVTARVRELARVLSPTVATSPVAATPTPAPRRALAYCAPSRERFLNRWVDANPTMQPLHRDLQCEMFGAVRDAGLDRDDREGMINAINVTLGTSYTSRTEMTPLEMAVFTRAVQLGVWASGWRLAYA